MNQIFLLHNYAFLKLLSFRLLLVLGYQVMAVTVGWHVYQITHDTLALGLIGLAEVVPYFSCALFAGHAVDHYCSRRFFGALAASLLFVNAIALTCIALGWLQGNATFWIYACIAFTGVARAFIAPSYTTLFAIIVPRDLFAKATGLGTAIFQIGLVLGPVLGGLLVGFGSKVLAYQVASLLCFGATVAMLSLTIKEPPAVIDGPAVFASIGQGLGFVFNNPIILGALSLDMFAVLFGGAVALLPAFIQDIYKMGPEALGILRAAPGIGAIFIGLWLARHPINLHAGRWLLCSVAGFGVCMIAFGLSSYYWLAAVLLLLSGICDGTSVVLRHTILQLATPDAMRGRVTSINGIFIGSSNELGAFESGVAARLMGLVPSVIFGGLMTLGVVAVTAKLNPALNKLDLNQLK